MLIWKLEQNRTIALESVNVDAIYRLARLTFKQGDVAQVAAYLNLGD